MTHEETLDFLRQQQPMPKDEVLTKELIDKYYAVRHFFLEHKNKECIPLLLSSFWVLLMVLAYINL